MRHANGSLFLLMFVGLALAVPASASAQRHGVLRGSVLREADDGPIGGSEVSIPALGLAATTDSSGKFRLVNVPAGPQIVWVRRVGFERVSAVLTFVAGDTLERDFSLVQAATVLPKVYVNGTPSAFTGKLADFEGRRRLGMGHFLTAADLEKDQGRKLADVMARIPGPWVQRGTFGGKAWLVGGRGQVSFMRNGPQKLDAADAKAGAKLNLCYSAVVLDGSFVYQGQDGESLFDLNSIDPESIAGLEVYNSTAEIPAMYNGTRSTCGLVVIWTKA